jgi:hypothetical protein
MILKKRKTVENDPNFTSHRHHYGWSEKENSVGGDHNNSYFSEQAGLRSNTLSNGRAFKENKLDVVLKYNINR